ncbi:hypothetical protein DPM19_31235 [Actinomadura craniellae]|uniref:Magnesium transporter NIPA n=1 Tax=Actinomadura craniellae TaxID=2231787 RepID=A0A365GWT0_9ACTN|nr:DMT family transporter [Actinomadura craniellae]RAY11232.1 hypothetical protein DPM19_31235 [Actinomadura craniellae]
MRAELLAFCATACYYLSYAIWKIAAERMPPLRGTRPFHLAWQGVTSAWWWLGLMVTLGGVALQIAALRTLPLAVAVPIFVASLVCLLILAMVGFGERLNSREWLCLGLFAGAVLLVVLSVEEVPRLSGTSVSVLPVLAVVVPAVAIPVLLFVLDGRSPEGRHARPIAGVVYGIGTGVLNGTAELMIKGIADLYRDGEGVADIAATPYPHALLVTAITAFMMIQVALQRYRMAVVISVGTVIAQGHLLLTGTLLYGEALPRDPGAAVLRVLALATAVAAVLLFPRQEDPALTRRHRSQPAPGPVSPAS